MKSLKHEVKSILKLLNVPGAIVSLQSDSYDSLLMGIRTSKNVHLYVLRIIFVSQVILKYLLVLCYYNCTKKDLLI